MARGDVRRGGGAQRKGSLARELGRERTVGTEHAATRRGIPERKRRELGPYWPADGSCPADRACDVHGAAMLLLRLSTGIEPPPTGGFELELGAALGLPASLGELLISALSSAAHPTTKKRPSVGALAEALGELVRTAR